MYLRLNKRQTTWKLIRYNNITDKIFINLIELDNPYKDGTKYAIIENSKSPFCSNGLFINLLDANIKFDLMVKNIESVLN